MSVFDDIRPTTELHRSDIVYTAGASIHVNAPAKHVFNVITELSEYARWNTDTPKMELQEAGPLQKGSTVMMKVVMVDQNRDYNVPIEIQRVEAPNANDIYVLAWRGKMLPTWFAISERVQEVRLIDENPDMCEVINYESMAGWGAYVFKYIMGIPNQMKKFNTKYLENLKERAETTFQ